MARRSHLISGRITESECPLEDVAFYEDKKKKGYSDTTFLREVVNIARKHADGTLLREEISKILDEKLPLILMNFIKTHTIQNVSYQQNRIQSQSQLQPNIIQNELAVTNETNELLENTSIETQNSQEENNDTGYYELTDKDKKELLKELGF